MQNVERQCDDTYMPNHHIFHFKSRNQKHLQTIKRNRLVQNLIVILWLIRHNVFTLNRLSGLKPKIVGRCKNKS